MKTNFLKSRTLILGLSFFSSLGFPIFEIGKAAPTSPKKAIFVYHRLAMKDLEQMDLYLRGEITKANREPELKFDYFLEATVTIFSRPNFDDLIEKIVPTLENALRENQLLDKVYEHFVNDTLNHIKDPAQNEEAIITYVIALENWVTYFKRKLNQEPYPSLFKKIADQKIELKKSWIKSAKIQMPYDLKNPSALASELLKKKLGKD